MRRRRPGERGFVLVAVLWLGVALAIAASGFLSDTRRESYRLRAEIGTAEAVEMARSALNLALADLSRSDGGMAPRDGTPITLAMPGGTARFRIRDEKGKVDLNHAPPTFLAAVLENLGGVGRDAFDHATLADQLLKAARDAKEAGTAPSLGELITGAGLAPETAARATLFLTLHSYTARINPEVAPSEVLAAVPGVSPEDVAAIMEARRLGEALPSMGMAQGWFITTEGPVYSILVSGHTASGITAQMSAMVVQDGRNFSTGRRRFRVLEARLLP